MKPKPINQQTPGPLMVGRRRFSHEGQPLNADGEQVAYTLPHLLASEANAALLAASYTAFDRAARELGVDAVELAESLDLAAIIGTLRDLSDAIECADECARMIGANDPVAIRARALLSKLSAKR